MKTSETISLEQQIYFATKKQGTFGCFEVTIGWFGKERVDYMTYDTKRIWRCYEIKVSKSDFHSNAKHTFCGHYNYFVMTQELYNQVKDEIPNDIGVYIGKSLGKKAKKRELTCDEQILKNSMIRSLSREHQKHMYSRNKLHMEILERQSHFYQKEAKKFKNESISLKNFLSENYGHDAYTKWRDSQ